MRACPSSAIDIEIEKDEKGKRHLKGFTVDYNICCFCGLCEEACSFAAIKLANKYEFPEFDKHKLVWNMKKLAEMGYDVPYEKPEKKKPAEKPAAKPATPKAETTEPAPAPNPGPAPAANANTSTPPDKTESGGTAA